MLYKETVKSINKKSGSSAIMALIIVVSIVVIIGVCNFLYNRFGISYASYIAFILCILLGIYVYRKKLREYSYCITDRELIFEQIVGTKIKPIVNVKLSHIRYFCQLADENENVKKYDQNYILLFNKKSPNAYVLMAREGGRNIRIVFEPSSKLVQLIKERNQ